MCGGLPQLKIGSVVRRYTKTGPQAVVDAVLGEVTSINKDNPRKFTYYVTWDSGSTTAHFRGDVVLTSRKKHAKVIERMKHRGEEIRQRMTEKRAARQEGGAK